jgi:hypothetical protein
MRHDRILSEGFRLNAFQGMCDRVRASSSGNTADFALTMCLERYVALASSGRC